jgi:hypothetical protein
MKVWAQIHWPFMGSRARSAWWGTGRLRSGVKPSERSTARSWHPSPNNHFDKTYYQGTCFRPSKPTKIAHTGAVPRPDKDLEQPEVAALPSSFFPPLPYPRD